MPQSPQQQNSSSRDSSQKNNKTKRWKRQLNRRQKGLSSDKSSLTSPPPPPPPLPSQGSSSRHSSTSSAEATMSNDYTDMYNQSSIVFGRESSSMSEPSPSPPQRHAGDYFYHNQASSSSIKGNKYHSPPSIEDEDDPDSSMMEYSSPSDTGDHYFSPSYQNHQKKGLLGEHYSHHHQHLSVKNRRRHHQSHNTATNNKRGNVKEKPFHSSKSTFRFRDAHRSESARVIRFGSGLPLAATAEEEEDKEMPFLSASRDSENTQKSQQQRQQIFRSPDDTTNNQQKPQATEHTNTRKKSGDTQHQTRKSTASLAHTAENWVNKMAYSFRSPKVVHQKRAERSGSPRLFAGRMSSNSSVVTDTLSPPPIAPRPQGDEPKVLQCSDEALVPIPALHESTPLLTTTDSGAAAPNHRSMGDERRGSHRMRNFISQSETTVTQQQKNNGHHNVVFPPHVVVQSKKSSIENSFRSLQVATAACYLLDYEANRPPILPHTVQSVTARQVRLYGLRFGSSPQGGVFTCILAFAVFALFLSSGLEGFRVYGNDQQQYDQHDDNYVDTSTIQFILTVLNLFAITVLALDVWICRELQREDTTPLQPQHRSKRSDYTTQQKQYQTYMSNPNTSLRGRKQMQSRQQGETPRCRRSPSQKDRLIKPLVFFCVVLGVENLARLLLTPDEDSLVLFTSFFKPVVFYYISSQAREAFEALGTVIRIVVFILIIEILLILMFAAVACRLFGETSHDMFGNLTTSWLTLFELSTTVVNPSAWMSLYAENKYSALYFMFFIVVSVFYLHSLVLSVVFQTYIQACSQIHERTASDREDAIQLAYLALQQGKPSGSNGKHNNDTASPTATELNVVDTSLVRETLRLVRPHYSAIKINALVEMVDPSCSQYVDYLTFRTKIRQALNASIRTARGNSRFAMSIELIAVIVAIVNFAYVIAVSSEFDHAWFNRIQEVVGILITAVAGFELLIRFNPLRLTDFTPMTRLSATFDGLALLGFLTSAVGICMYFTDQRESSLELILMGRAVDMIRVMRFFQLFRDVVRRSADVIPALAGPVVLILTTLHVFVYVGMTLWGGAIVPGEHQEHVTSLYDLNNFNSYPEGVVTMFQVLTVNDWQAIAQVFLLSDTPFSNPAVVYLFFISGNLIGVSIMLNVLTAFFVESFVTKLADSGAAVPSVDPINSGREGAVSPKKDVKIKNSKSSFRSIASSGSLSHGHHANSRSTEDDTDNSSSGSSALFEFDIYEREGFDKIMQTLAGTSSMPYYVGDSSSTMGQRICSYLESFESLTPGRGGETVGYLVCDQVSLERFGNRRFQMKAIGFLTANELHVVVNDMHSELLALASRDNCQDRFLTRTFLHKQADSKILEITAALLETHPAVSLFCNRVLEEQPQPLPSDPSIPET